MYKISFDCIKISISPVCETPNAQKGLFSDVEKMLHGCWENASILQSFYDMSSDNQDLIALEIAQLQL